MIFYWRGGFMAAVLKIVTLFWVFLHSLMVKYSDVSEEPAVSFRSD